MNGKQNQAKRDSREETRASHLAHLHVVSTESLIAHEQNIVVLSPPVEELNALGLSKRGGK